MPANVDALVQEGITALKSGRHDEARKALMKAVEIDQGNEMAWLWLSGAVDSLEEREICLENVLELNPSNAKAVKGLEDTHKEMKAKGIPSSRDTAPPASAAPADGSFGRAFGGAAADQSEPDSAFAGTGFDSNPYSGTSNDPALTGWSGFDSPANSVDWGAPGAAPGLGPTDIPQTTEEEYDSWMAGLSFNGGNSGGSVPAFDTTDFDLNSGPFGNTSSAGPDSSAGGSIPSGQSAADPFADYQFGEPAAAPSADPFNLNGTSSPFGGAEQSEDPFRLPRAAVPEKPSESFDFGPAASEPVAEKPAASPFGDFSFDTPAEPKFGDEDDQVESAAAAESPFSFRIDPPSVTSGRGADSAARPRVAGRQPSSGASVFTTVDSTPSLANPSIYFQSIPEDIQVSGVSAGTGGAVSPVLLITVGILLLLNIGSLLLLIANLGR